MQVQEAARMLLCLSVSNVAPMFPKLDSHSEANPRPHQDDREIHFATDSDLILTVSLVFLKDPFFEVFLFFSCEKGMVVL